MNTCRLCLTQEKSSQMHLIWDNESNLLKKIQECLSMEIIKKDKLPSMVCISCVNRIDNWIHFKQKCIESNNYLLSKIDHVNDLDCKMEITLEKHLDEPMQSHEANVYSCEICNEEFNTCFDYLSHQEQHNGENVFKCSKCNEVYSNKNDLVNHERNHKSPCPQCGKMILKTSLKLHLIKHTDKHKCPHCSNCFNCKASLEQHIITVHTNIKNHICNTCGKCFSSQSSMRVHLKSHSDERTYPCKLCNYAGRTASAIYIHMSTHANDTCICEVCSKIFKSTRNLNDHLRRVHNKNKKHECLQCKKRFVDKYRLSIHMRCHTGVRPYKCLICDKAFIRSDGLKEHMITHGERTIYDCESCGKKFTSKRSINRHSCNVA